LYYYLLLLAMTQDLDGPLSAQLCMLSEMGFSDRQANSEGRQHVHSFICSATNNNNCGNFSQM